MLAQKYFQAIILTLLWVCPVYGQQAGDMATQKQVQHDFRLQAKEQKRVENKLVKKMDQIYREIIAAYKAHRFDYAQEKIVTFEELLDPNLLPEKYFEKMTVKMNSARKWMREFYQKVQAKERRDKEDKLFNQLKLSAQKKFLYDDEENTLGRVVLPKSGSVPKPDVSKAENAPKVVKAPRPSPKVVKAPRPSPRVVKAPRPSPKVVKAPRPSPKVVKVPTPSPKVQITRIPQRQAKETPPDITTSAQISKKALELKKEYEVALAAKRIEPKEKIRSLPSEKNKEYVYKLHGLYTDGLLLFRKGLYEKSLKVMSEVERVIPDYKMTRKYIKLIDAKLAQEQTSQEQKPPSRDIAINKDLIIFQTLNHYAEQANTVRKDIR